MRAGKLRHLVYVDENVGVKGASGAMADSWVNRGTEWASVEPMSGTESMGAAQMVLAQVTTRIRLRYSPLTEQINAKWRIRYRSVIYNISSVINTKLANREIVLMCSSGANEG